MKTNKEKIISKALELLENAPDGIRHTDLVDRIRQELSVPENTIRGAIWRWLDTRPQEVYKPARGLYLHTKFKNSGNTVQTMAPPIVCKEEDLYKPFAEWLVEIAEECTKAIALGGNKFGSKWGTPDVIGVRKPRESDIIKPPIEVVSAEVKLSTNDLITAFGQACSYKLFSHKSYVVIPKAASAEDIGRLTSLCTILGIGLVVFEFTDSNSPVFEFVIRAVKHEPDIFYANDILDKDIEKQLF